MDFDVALVELSIPAPKSYTIQTVCLPSPWHSFIKTMECYIIGWGAVKEDGEFGVGQGDKAKPKTRQVVFTLDVLVWTQIQLTLKFR